jgi:hypothetical protein
MASPVNIRVTAPFPFPALVVGAAPIVVAKANGIFTVSFDIADLTAHVPSAADLAAEYWIVYDSIAKTYYKVALSNLGVGGARLQRAVSASPIVVANNDQIINFNINAGSPTCQLPASSTRSGVPLTFKDAGGHAAAHNLTFTTTGGETMDGIASGGVALSTNFGQITFTPYNDGTNSGWAIG